MQAESVTGTDPVGSETLAEGLMLVRASTLKVIRLQLAIERRDRRVVLEAVDDLVELDRKLGSYLADVPALFGQEPMRDALDREAAELQREKLTLAAEVIRRPETVVSFPTPEPVGAAADVAEESSWVEWEEEPPRRRAWKWTAAGLLLAGAVAGAAFVPGAQEVVMAGAEMIR